MEYILLHNDLSLNKVKTITAKIFLVSLLIFGIFTCISLLFMKAEAQVAIPTANIAYDPVNSRMYVANQVGDNDDSVFVINTSTDARVGEIRVGNQPDAIAYDTVNKRMYVANERDDTVSVIDTITNTVVGSPIRVGNTPLDIA